MVNVSDSKVTLVTSSDLPNLDPSEAGLPDALRERGLEPQIKVWNDPNVDWSDAGTIVIRSVRDYGKHREEFLKWAHSVKRVLNHPGVMEWNSDKHYLLDLKERGLPTIPTMWLEPGENLSKHQIHTRFPAHGDFVVKPAVSSGGRGTGRYTATDPASRSQAILHAQHELSRGRTVMVQRYLEDIDHSGEISLVFLNGVASYLVEKAPMLHPRFRAGDRVHEEVVRSANPREKEWRWGERVRTALHDAMRAKIGRDHLLLFNRVDLVPAPNNPDEFYIMEISLIDGSLYLNQNPEFLNKFADAIMVRANW